MNVLNMNMVYVFVLLILSGCNITDSLIKEEKLIEREAKVNILDTPLNKKISSTSGRKLNK